MKISQKKLIIKDFIPVKNLKSKKNNLQVKNILEKIIKNLDKKKDPLHFFSKKFQLQFNSDKFKKFKKFNTIVIIGMGGSALGAKAIYSFLEHKTNKKFLFIDNLDENKLVEIKKQHFNKLLFIIISKSGNTIETLTNVNLIFKPKFNFSNSIIITEKKSSALNSLAEKKNILLIDHEKYIGGRYSIFTEVGMLPAFLMGFDFKKFRKNIYSLLYGKNKKLIIQNVNNLKKIYKHKKISSIVFLNYNSKLNDFVYWCQQLMAESLGKKGKGLMPILSFAPKDHHSLLQLYLEGPKNKMFYIISSKNINKIIIKNNIFKNSFKYLNNTSLDKIITAQKLSLIKSLKKRKIPYREIFIKDYTEEILGELFAYFMLETVTLGKSLNTNPYDQPAVEEVKKFTKIYLN